MGTPWVVIHLDSQLVVQRVQITFDIKDAKLKKYCEAVEQRKENFMEVRLKQVPRVKYSKANNLTCLASSLGDWLTREVMMQMELLLQVETKPELEEINWRIKFMTYF